MRRRTLLKVGLATGALLAVAGGSLALLQPARRDGKFTATGSAIFTALAPAVLATLLPADAAARSAAIAAYLPRVEAAIDGLPPALQGEVDELLTIAGSAPGRLALVGLRSGWAEASAADVQAALSAMRESSLVLRQQAYHALRDLTSASYFSDAAPWAAVGYPGPRPV
jgi:hypothetical protein